MTLVTTVFALAAAMLPLGAPAQAQTEGTPADVPARGVEAIVLTGAQLPGWSGPAADGVAEPYPSGASDDNPFGDEKRDAHNGTLVVPPPELQTGVDPDAVAAYSWTDGGFAEVPVQIDERFPYFLANGRSNFGFYSGTDKELSYAWDVESWKKIAGECFAEYPGGESAMQDPVGTLDDDDEVVFMASDAGRQAPLDASGPTGTGENRQEIRVVDPRDPSNVRFVYLFTQEGGSSFTADNGYVDYERDTNADEWIDKNTFSAKDPEKLGTSNTGYGPNLPGTVCNDNPDTSAVETQRDSEDRFVRDGVTVSTDTYQWRASGRWMVRGMRITSPDTTRAYGPDLIDRWKGRAFQQSPDSSISLVGFEDEQVNWEGNSALLGELTGPVRAIREVWGADSGTNVTKTETFYRNYVTYRYRVRVHPIPPDGLYTSWDYNQGVASTYYNETKTEGVPIDGTNDDIGQVDELPNGDPAFFDAPDPTFTKPLAFLNWEQVSGRDDTGSLVYMFELKNAQGLLNPAVTPYYRDDACFDDGTGDNPSPRSYPGESYEWMEDKAAEGDEGDAVAREYLDRPCFTEAPEGYEGEYRQGCFGCHGIHYFATHDSDNALAPVPLTEIDGQQYQWAVPTATPTNVGDRYANTVKTPLMPFASLQSSTAGEGEPGGPAATRLEITGDLSGQTTDEATLAATLSDADGPVAGKEITFTLDGQPAGAATTDGDGLASVQVILSGPPRETSQTASFAGDGDHAASSVSGPFEIVHDDSATSLTLSRQPAIVEASATVTDADSGSGLAGRSVRFLVNGEQVSTAVTDESGTARTTFPVSRVKSGDVITAVFDGDDFYLGSQAEQTVPKPGPL
jgi:hypothetical protein